MAAEDVYVCFGPHIPDTRGGVTTRGDENVKSGVETDDEMW